MIAILFSLTFALPASAQKNKSLWSATSVSKLQNELQWSRKIDPVVASYYTIDINSLKQQLVNAP
ncbi:MAG: hypothetical protein ABF247_06460, partial [Nonlabens sp.]